jgi:hypothetical protein
MLPQIVQGIQYLAILVFVVGLLTYLIQGHTAGYFVRLMWTSLGVGITYGLTEGLLQRWDN